MSPGSIFVRVFLVALVSAGFGFAPGPAVAQTSGDNGLVVYDSDASFDDTVARIEEAVTSRGLFVMRVFDHAGGAAAVGNTLEPNTVTLFGNPRVGSQIMACSPTAGIDLPQKLLVWEAEEDVVRVAYNNPDWLERRHSIHGCDEILGRVRATLDAIARDVSGYAGTGS